jgi:hypothetical protein
MKILYQIHEELNIAKICLDSIKEFKTHGARNIIKAKSRILKLIWLFSLLASTGYCIYEMAISVLANLQYNVVTVITPIYKAPKNFTAVQICNYQAISSYVTNITNQYNITINTYPTIKQYTDQVERLVN